jgi:hypothetical protein
MIEYEINKMEDRKRTLVSSGNSNTSLTPVKLQKLKGMKQKIFIIIS